VQGTPNHRLRALRSKPTQRRVAVQIGGEGITFGAGSHYAVELSPIENALAPQCQELRIQGPCHAVSVHRFHRAPEGRRNLQQVGHALDVARAVLSGGVQQGRVEEHGVPLRQRRAHPAVFRVRDHLAETITVSDMVDVMDAIARRGSHGVLLKAPDVPAVAEAAARLQSLGIPVVTLVTDIRQTCRSAYVGLENRSAGRTAAYLMGQWLGATPAGILVSSSGQRFQGEGERIKAFVQAFETARPACGVRVLDAGQGLQAPTVAAVGRLLVRYSDVAAVYSVGGANAAILAAFDRARRPCRVFIGHDLDDDNLALLRAGRLSAVLHHDLHHDLHMACLSVMQAHGAAPVAWASTRSSVEVITPFNLPASFEA